MSSNATDASPPFLEGGVVECRDLPINKRARTSIDDENISSVIDVDAIVEKVLRDDVENFELCSSTPEQQLKESTLSTTTAINEIKLNELDGDIITVYSISSDDESEQNVLDELLNDSSDDNDDYEDDDGDDKEFAHDTVLLTEEEDHDVSDDFETPPIHLQAPDDVIDGIMTLGPNLYVDKQMREGVLPDSILNILGYPLPDGLVNADFEGKWAYVKRFLMKYVYERPRLGLSSIEDVLVLLKVSKKIMIITGAGISVSCGIPDFRSQDGLYSKIQQKFDLPEPECMFDIEFFRIDPEPFFSFARELLPNDTIQPSFSHYFIADLEQRGQLQRQYTQNIDTIEKTAGIDNVIYCHGSFATATCIECASRFAFEEFKEKLYDEAIVPICDHCEGVIKPDIVFFGEPLPKTFDDHLAIDCFETDLVLVIGSSLKVHPVSSIPDLIPPNVPQILINRESLDHNFDIELLGDCDVILAELFRRLGRTFLDPIPNQRFNPLLSAPTISPRFLDPIYHIFPGAKQTALSTKVPHSTLSSPASSEGLVGDSLKEEMVNSINEFKANILPTAPVALNLPDFNENSILPKLISSVNVDDEFDLLGIDCNPPPC